MKRHPRTAILVLGWLGAGLLATGCEDLLQEPESGNTPLPIQLREVSGNGQSGAPGSALPVPLRVRVVGSDEVPRPGLWLEWSVVGGRGSVAPRNAFSDAEGIAEATWVLGPEEGPQKVRAVAVGGTPMEFDATAVTP